jgi:hypothetical protein
MSTRRLSPAAPPRPHGWLAGAVLLLVSAPAPAQQDPLVSEHIDEFTNARVVTVQMRDTASGPQCSFVARDGRCELVVKWTRKGDVPGVILTGDVLMFKLEDGEVLSLFSSAVGLGEHYRNKSDEPVTATTCSYPITAKELSTMSKTWVAKIRICYYDGCLEWTGSADPMWQYSFARTAAAFKEMEPFAPTAPVPQTPQVVQR